MDMAKVAPELRSAARWMPTYTADNGFSRGLGRWITRMMASAKIAGVDVERRRESPRLLLYRPREQHCRGALLWLHGGGFVMGAPAMDDLFCAETCRSLGIVIASVDYRLAPEHPYPTPMDDAFAAWSWLQASADAHGIDADCIAVGGQSAGGGLAAGLVQRIHDTGGPRAVAQWLFCPMLDDRTTTRRELDAVGHLIWSNRSNVIAWRAYLGRPPGSDMAPAYAAPARREDLEGLPPAWIGVGDIDLFFDEDQDYAERLGRAGVETSFVPVGGAPHGFESWARKSDLARQYLAGARTWLGDKLGCPTTAIHRYADD